MMKTVRKLLHEPRMTGVIHDSEERLGVHRRILSEKKIMREVFVEFYDECMRLDNKFFSGNGERIELGSGSSFFKECYPDVISSDVQPGSNLDRVLDAQAMDLPAESVRAFYGINCFHHLPKPRLFFEELQRTLAVGGGCILIEPYQSQFGRWFYQRLHDEEIFDINQVGWNFSSPKPGVIANQALSGIVFDRERGFFEKEFPELEIVETSVLTNYPRYLLSGGLNFRQLVPDSMVGLVKWTEKVVKPLRSTFGLHWIVTLRRRSS